MKIFYVESHSKDETQGWSIGFVGVELALAQDLWSDCEYGQPMWF